MRAEDFGKLLLRLVIGGLLLMHGIWKISNSEQVLGFVGKLLTDHGLPDAIKYGVFAGEVLAPVLVIIGLFTRPAAIIIVINMAMAIYLANMQKIDQVKMGAWGIELEALYLIGALAIAFLGAGRISLRRGAARVD